MLQGKEHSSTRWLKMRWTSIEGKFERGEALQNI